MSPVGWGALVALSLGVSGIVARIVGRAIGPLPAIVGNFAVGLLALVLWFLITGDPILWRLDGAHWLVAAAAPFTICSLWRIPLAPAHLDVEKYTRDGFRRNGMISLVFYGPPR